MFDDTAFVLVADHGMQETDPTVTGDWDVALREAGIPFRDEGYSFLYLGDDRPDRAERRPTAWCRRPVPMPKVMAATTAPMTAMRSPARPACRPVKIEVAAPAANSASTEMHGRRRSWLRCRCRTGTG